MKILVLVFMVGAAVAASLESQPSYHEIEEELNEYLKKAQTIGDSKTLEESTLETPWANAWENSGKHQGDILLMKEEAENIAALYSGNGTQRTGLINTWNRWPGNTIIYEFAAGHYTAAQMQQVEATFNMFNTRTCIRFLRRTNQRDFVRITSYSDGCYAHVGHWPGFGAHTLNLAWPGCFNHFIIIHEWLHVVGFEHMHQTYTRNNYVTINFQNVIQGFHFAFDMYSNNRITMLNLPYEYASNMHYERFAFSRNGQPTIVPRWNDFGQMGQLNFVTGYDILRINRLYNCPGAWDAPVRTEDANTPAYTLADYERYLQELQLKEKNMDEEKAIEKSSKEILNMEN